ncbi:unnamed protein product [Ilex paraguariensis]|uniref:Serine/threonine-protein kinase ATM n=1 Tax=Ilex paraguariensis TaxID=185542 RepID=A0ABC8QXW0_9AQUA
MGQYLLKLLHLAVTIIEKTYNDVRCGCLSSNSTFDSMDSIVASFKSFGSSPLFNKWRDKDVIDGVLSTAIIQSIERLLKALAKLYDESSECSRDLQFEIVQLDKTDSNISVHDSVQLNTNRSMILDMELDVNDDFKDLDFFTIGRTIGTGISISAVNWKMDIISLISSFFSILPFVTWETLFNLMQKESDTRVLENLLVNLCQHPQWSSSRKFSDLVISLNDLVDLRANLKLPCLEIIAAICCLLQTLLSLDMIADNENDTLPSRGRVPEQSLISLGDLVSKVAENDLFHWFGRVKLIDCICNFILLRPHIGQTMIEKLLLMLRDPDYRVRFSLGRRIGVLFQTWDGHDELFQDICSNFGAKLVVSSKKELVTAKEVLAAGPQPRPTMETIIITLMHIALHSEKIELEAVFMMCVVAAIDPCQRELVGAVLDNLSRQLQYTTRTKYMEELMGQILFCWVACGVSLVALVETRGLFVLNVEPINFIQFCCPWLLPALILHGDISNMYWIAKVACQPSAVLVKNHFVPIFAVCITLHCSKKSGWEKGATVLQSSILSIAEMSENERDKLIRNHTNSCGSFVSLDEGVRKVSIVNHICSLASCASDPVLPFFCKDAVENAIQTVVDGFLEMEDHTRISGILDKINIFRPDRVFMFIVEMHYKITAAVHFRHKRNRLAGVEVLVNVLGHRAAVSSTSKFAPKCMLVPYNPPGKGLSDVDIHEPSHALWKVSIVNHICSLASCASDPVLPFFCKDAVENAIQTVVDGFLEMEDHTRISGILDKINIFRPDRVFMFIVEMHYKITAAVHFRHKQNRLAGVEVLVNVLGHRAAVSSTSNYIFNLVGQFISCPTLRDQSCSILSTLLKTFRSNPSKETTCVLGELIQFLVSKLVECCTPTDCIGENFINNLSEVLSLLHQLTVESDPSLHRYLKELEPFPELDVFDRIRKFQQDLSEDYSPRDHLLKFVQRSCYLPPRLLVWSLKALHKKLFMGETNQRDLDGEDIYKTAYWHSDHEIVHAVWTLVHMCSLDDTQSFGTLVSDFVSRLGIGDPHRVVFHLPGDSWHIQTCRLPISDSATESCFVMDTGISDELLNALIRLLKKYLMDDSVKIIDITSQALRGILSTERGQRALLSFNSYERSLIEVHSKGINVELVQNSLADLERKFNGNNIKFEVYVVSFL